MADEVTLDGVEETTDPSWDSTDDVTEEGTEEYEGGTNENREDNSVVYKLHEEIDNLNLVLDHLERKNGDIYSRIEQLLASFQHTETEEE